MPGDASDRSFPRLADAGDLDAVVYVDARAFTRHWPAEDFAAQLVDPIVAIWVIEDENGPAAYVHVRAVAGEAELLNIAVLPRARRQGLAARLLRHAQEEAFAAGTTRMFLEVRADNDAALRLYRREGWEQVGIRKRYYSEDGSDAIILSVDLVERARAQVRALDCAILAE